MITLPARPSAARLGRFIPLDERWRLRGWLKIALRERAKGLPLYHQPIALEPPVTGRTDTGVPVPVDTLGRWLWGVPGYQGVAVFDGFADPPGVWLPLEAPPEAEELIRSAAA
jgi:hypothetical protein